MFFEVYLFKYKKSLGQNFLIDTAAIKKIIASADLSSKDNVLEIGPGDGALTSYFNDVNRLILVEKDSYLSNKLAEKYLTAEIINEDFLKINISKYIKETFKIVSNIPYNITGPIIEKIFFNRDLFSLVILTIQKEVAERVVAKPGNKNRSLLSYLSQTLADVSLIQNISKNSFYPRPNVDSATVSFKFKKVDFDFSEIYILKRLFSQKRKQLINLVNTLLEDKDSSKSISKNLFIDLNLDHKLRIEDLSNIDIARLVKKVKDYL
jgi:16S rRNA (adenine1518-N6/adenine1519-N6)-dimethyltransferase